MTQKETVYRIVKFNAPIRTKQVKIYAMELGCSCADRFLRYLATEGKIEGYKEEGNRTKTWRLKREAKQLNCFGGG
ncbi:MAG: hypothetical protein KAX20_07005 [Candidatus Omnitrophica bacterium]|nr:hypothetical protein [Candidatus Omnitrophota bacterium]